MVEYRKIITADDENLAARCAKGLVSIVDDDSRLLDSLRLLVEYEGYACFTYCSVDDFLADLNRPIFPGPRCILSDISMPGKNGLHLQELLPGESDQPMIFMSGVSRVEDAAQAFRRGAVHFITKPINDIEIFDIIKEALQISAERQALRRKNIELIGLISRLTPRERELTIIMMEGLSIKEIARKMGITDRAVKLHKKNVMEKLNAKSLLDIAKLPIKDLFRQSP